MENKGELYLAAARAYLGTRWRRMGSNAQGMDCAGLLVASARDAFGIEYDPGRYLNVSTASFACNHVANVCERVTDPRYESGDILVFALSGAASAHCGVYDASKGTVIHATAGQRQVVEERLTPHWRARVTAAYRFA